MIITTLINQFNGGLSEDKRAGWVGNLKGFTTNKFSLTKHFDAFTYPCKLVPYYKTENIENKTYDIVKFLLATNSAGTERFYGYGIDPGTTKAEVYISTYDGTTWDTLANNKSTNTNRREEVFFYYKDYIYVFRTGYLMRFDTTLAAVWNETYQNITFTNLAQPVHHPSDDVAYFFTDNLVHSLNDTTWTGSVLTLPADMKITCACAYGNYLAIGCAPLGTQGKSIVFLWDRDSSLSTLTERIDFSRGKLIHLANLDNKLIGIVDQFITDGSGLGGGNLLIKQASGTFGITLNKLTTDTNSGASLPSTSFVRDNILYFPAGIPLDGDTRLGIWAINSSGQATLDFVCAEATSYEGIYQLGNEWWIAHSNDGSVNRTDDNTSYQITEPGIYESLIFNAGDSSMTKKLVSATVMTEPLPTALAITKVILKYRKDEDTSWTTIFEHTDDNSISHTAVNIESSGDNLPSFKEIQFQISSIGGAVITGLKFKVETIDSDIA